VPCRLAVQLGPRGVCLPRRPAHVAWLTGGTEHLEPVVVGALRVVRVVDVVGGVGAAWAA
jgi:hypothetical protein